jgi:glycosyltransferase involved in cell wall biosynthesis
MKRHRKGKLKILFVTPCYKPYLGGTERIVERLSKEYLKLEGVDRVGVLSTYMDFNFMPPRENSWLPAREIIDGVEIYRVKFYPQKLLYFYCLPAGLFSIKAKRILNDFDADVIHFLLCEWYIANLWVYLLTRGKCIHIFTVPFHEMPHKLKFVPMRFLNILLGRLVNKVQVHSEFIRQRIIDYYHVPANKISAIFLGSNAEFTHDLRLNQQPHDCIRFLSVGRLNQDKGQLELVKAYHMVLRSFNKRTKLILVGGDGGDKKKIQQYIDENNLSGYVELKGFLPDKSLQLLYQQVDIFVLLTKVESFGIAFAEAQSYALPIIGYAIGAVKSVYKRGAILVEPSSRKMAGEALRLLVNDDGFRRELGREAYEFAMENFCWKKSAKAFMNLYVETIKEAR